jgi:hypothetical protein
VTGLVQVRRIKTSTYFSASVALQEEIVLKKIVRGFRTVENVLSYIACPPKPFSDLQQSETENITIPPDIGSRKWISLGFLSTMIQCTRSMLSDV